MERLMAGFPSFQAILPNCQMSAPNFEILLQIFSFSNILGIKAFCNSRGNF